MARSLEIGKSIALTGAALRLEYLWHDYCHKGALCLFCAYPRAYFTDSPESSIKMICAAHSQVVSD